MRDSERRPERDGGGVRDGSRAQDRPKPAPWAAGLLALQSEAGNRAVARLLDPVRDRPMPAPAAPPGARTGAVQRTPAVQRSPQHPPQRAPAVQRIPVVQREGTAGTGGVSFRGQRFTEDPGQLKTLLETLIGERGHDAATTVAYAFLRMTTADKLSLQLSGVDIEQLERVQRAFEPVVKDMETKRKDYLKEFEAEAAAGTRKLLELSRAELLKERDKYSEDGTPGSPPPDMDGMRTAAKALAAKRRAADGAAANAKAALEKMRTQNQAPGHPGAFAPAPIVPYFPDPALREAAGASNEAWWAQEREYAALRATHEGKFPALAMYAENEDGKAADRLGSLPTWGLFADSRMKAKIYGECVDRLLNNQSAAEDMAEDARIWSLPKMIQLTVKGKSATSYQEQWVKAEAARVQADAAEHARLLAAITLGVALVAGVLTLGTALAPAGAAGAALLAGMAATAQAASTGLTIALAYGELREYQFQQASSDTALDRAHAISTADPSLLWLAVTLAGVIMEVGALKSAFTSLKVTIDGAKAARKVVTLAEEVAKVPHLPPATAEQIVGKVAAEIEALPPLPSEQTVSKALECLSAWDDIPQAERGQVVLDALAGGDPSVILAKTGKNARELADDLGRTSAAGLKLQGALNRKAYDEAGPLLRALGPDLLDDVAVARIVGKNDIGGIKGQILEEVMEAETTRTLAAAADDPARKALLRGTEKEGTAEFINGSRITDKDGAPLTDGMVAVLRGDDEIVVIRAMEAKAGKVKSQLSVKAKTKFADLPKAEQAELRRAAARELRHTRPELGKVPLDEIIDKHEKEVMDIVAQESPQTSEWGQATKTSQRLGMDVDAHGNDVPAQILVDGRLRTVRFPGNEGRPQITGVLPSDLSQGTMAQKVSKNQGVKMDMTNVKGASQAKLKELSEAVAKAKGLPLK